MPFIFNVDSWQFDNLEKNVPVLEGFSRTIFLDTRLWFWSRSFWGSQQNSDFYPESQQKWKIKLLIIICLFYSQAFRVKKTKQ